GDHAATATDAAPAKRSRSDAFDLIGEHEEAALPPLTARREPLPDAVMAPSATIEVGRPIASAAVAGDAGRKKARWYRPRNILFASSGSLFAAIAALIIVVASADPNEYRGIFEQTLRSATGRDVTIGSVDFALSLSPTVVLKDVRLANVHWGSRAQMMVADRVEVEMALLPLVHGEYVAKRFIMRGADILLEVDPKGEGNWTFSTNEAGTAAHDTMALPQFGRLTIEESTLSYRDGGTGETETFALQRVTAKPSDDSALLDVDIDSVINGQ